MDLGSADGYACWYAREEHSAGHLTCSSQDLAVLDSILFKPPDRRSERAADASEHLQYFLMRLDRDDQAGRAENLLPKLSVVDEVGTGGASQEGSRRYLRILSAEAVQNNVDALN
ncbi:hypothetical protein D9M71_292070 [compost metagenome]